MASLCPHCWGRWAASQWVALDRALFGPSRLPPRRPAALAAASALPTHLINQALVYRCQRFLVPFRDFADQSTLRPILVRRIKRRQGAASNFYANLVTPRDVELRRLTAAGVTGGLEVIRAFPAPAETPGGPPAGWAIEVRQLVIVPTASLATFLAEPRCRGDVPVKVPPPIVQPTRTQLAEATAWACRYPRALLHGHGRFTLEVLRAQKGLRLSTRFGSCYGGTVGLPTVVVSSPPSRSSDMPASDMPASPATKSKKKKQTTPRPIGAESTPRPDSDPALDGLLTLVETMPEADLKFEAEPGPESRSTSVTAVDAKLVAASQAVETIPSQSDGDEVATMEPSRLVLEIDESDAVEVAAWLASDFVAEAEPATELAMFCVALADGGCVIVAIVNGTPGQCRPFVEILVTPDYLTSTYEHEPCGFLFGKHRIEVAGRPVVLSIEPATGPN